MDLHRAFIDAASKAGVKHVVYTSFSAASPDAQFTLSREHHTTEQYLKDSGIRWTFLRDSFYQNLMPHLAGKTGSSADRQARDASSRPPGPTWLGPRPPCSRIRKRMPAPPTS